jgi:serine/threonine protein kinase
VRADRRCLPLTKPECGRNVLPLVTSSESESSRGGGGPGPKLAFAPGDVVAGRYKIIDLVGSGGTGEVYRATDQALGGTVALKTLKHAVAKHPVLLERFRREAQNALRVTHPNVCRIRDIGIHTAGAQRRFFLTMELLEGESLAVRLSRRPPFSTSEAMPIVAQIAAGLQAAHDSAVVHRDLKPANIMLLSPLGTSYPSRAIITDFGLAISEEQIALGLTESSELIGTPEYMAPEQTEPGSAAPAIDIYAFGIITYEMLTARRPFASGATPVETLLRRRHDSPQPLRAVLANADPVWEAAILRCLERDPARRFARAADFAAALSARVVPPPPEEKGRWFGRGARKTGGR